jgi:hypothetical protein
VDFDLGIRKHSQWSGEFVMGYRESESRNIPVEQETSDGDTSGSSRGRGCG